MGGVAEQNQTAGEPAPTVDAAEGIDQQVVERRHLLQQVCCDRKYPSPLLAEGPEVTSSNRVSRRAHMGCSPKVDQVGTQRAWPKDPSGVQYSSNHGLARPLTSVRT